MLRILQDYADFDWETVDEKGVPLVSAGKRTVDGKIDDDVDDWETDSSGSDSELENAPQTTVAGVVAGMVAEVELALFPDDAPGIDIAVEDEDALDDDQWVLGTESDASSTNSSRRSSDVDVPLEDITAALQAGSRRAHRPAMSVRESFIQERISLLLSLNQTESLTDDDLSFLNNANAVLCTKLSAAADACGDKPKWLGNKLRDLAREFA